MAAKKGSGSRSKSAPSRRSGGKTAARETSGLGVSPRVISVLYILLAVFFSVILFVPSNSDVWTAIRSFFFGVFGFELIFIPPAFIYLCVMNEKEKKQIAHFKAKVVLCVAIVLLIGALIYGFTSIKYNQSGSFFAALGNCYGDSFKSNSYLLRGCGFFGGLLGYPIALCGQPAAAILTVALILALIFLLTNLSVKDVARAAGRTADRVKRAGEEKRRRRHERAEERRREREELRSYDDGYDKNSRRLPSDKENKPDRGYEEELADKAYEKPRSKRRRRRSDIDIPIDVDGADRKRGSDIDIPLDGAEQKKESDELDRVYLSADNASAADINPSDDLLNIITRASKPMGEGGSNNLTDIADEISRQKRSNRVSEGARQPDPETVPVELSKPVKKPERRPDPEPEPNELDTAGYHVESNDPEDETKPGHYYHFPPVQLLRLNLSNNDGKAMEELQQNSKKLIETLNSFGVNASIVNICRGPSVTRYELQPAPGVKISKITNLSDDIALNLAANGVRIEAPIPGKAAVGIEVPNKVVSMVSMRELIDSDVFRESKSKLTAVLGRDISGEIVVTDIAKMPHLLIAGTTGSGKSVCVNSILISILYKATPDEVKLLLIDPKMVEFSKYKGIPHLLVPIVSDAKKAAGALGWAVNEMLNRYKIFSEYDCKDIDSYNSLIEKNLRYIADNPPYENEEGEMTQPVLEVNGLPVAKEKMSRVVIAIDELADLMMAAPSEVEDSICRLAQMARAAGMHLILATQRPTVNVITGLIKANVPSRISLKVSSNMDSRTILDTGGGEKLIGKGDMLFSPVGAPKPIRVQGCYASEEEIEGVTGYIKKSSRAEYNAEIEETIKRIAAEELNGKKGASSSEGGDEESGEYDSRIDEAIQCVIEAGQASTSLVQRRLKVGYARAGRMVDEMEELGVVGPHQGSKPRDVLMTYNEWLERRNVLQNRSE